MAERHFVNGGVDNKWSTLGNWSLTEGGAGGQTIPTPTEDVFFDAGSPDCTINTNPGVCKTLTTSAYTHTLTFTYGITVSGNITIGANTLFAGTTTNKLRMIAAGTWTTNGKTIPQDIEIGGTTTFTCTLADDLTISGNLYLTNTTSTIFSGDFHITAAGTCTISGSQTLTLVHDVTIAGLTTISDANVIDGLFNWNTGGLSVNQHLSGTTTIVLTSGTWSCTASMEVTNNIIFAGDVVVSGNIYVAVSGGAAQTITYLSGTITTTDSTLYPEQGLTFDTEGMNWNSIHINVGMTITINSLLTLTGILALPNDAMTFNGTAGFSVANLIHHTLTGTRITTFEEGITYAITSSWVAALTSTYKYTFTSADAVTRAILTLGYGATQDLASVNPTRIDSSLGQCIFSYKGVFTDSLNWSDDLGHGRIIPHAGGESVTVAGITKDNAGVALGSCDVYLFRDNGGDTATYIAYQESNSVTGAYSFTVFPGSTYFVVAFKGGATPVMDVTDRAVTAV